MADYPHGRQGDSQAARRWAGAGALLTAGLVLEIGWLLVVVASVPLSESRGGFTADFLDALPLAAREAFDHGRGELMLAVGGLLGTDDRIAACRAILGVALPVTVVG